MRFWHDCAFGIVGRRVRVIDACEAIEKCVGHAPSARRMRRCGASFSQKVTMVQ